MYDRRKLKLLGLYIVYSTLIIWLLISLDNMGMDMATRLGD